MVSSGAHFSYRKANAVMASNIPVPSSLTLAALMALAIVIMSLGPCRRVRAR